MSGQRGIHVVYDMDGVRETDLVGHRITVHPGRDRQVRFRVYDADRRLIRVVGWTLVYEWERIPGPQPEGSDD